MGISLKKKMLLLLLVALLSVTGCGDTEKKENQQAYRQIGINCMTEGDYDGAVEAFQKALDQSLAVIGEMELDICYYKAQAQVLAGKPADALETYTALIDYDKKNAQAYFLRGSLYFSQQEKEKAEADFAQAIENADKSFEVYYSVANQLIEADERELAEGYLNEAVKLSAKTAEDMTWLGRIYLQLEDYDNAKSQLEAAVEQKSTKAQLYLGELYEAQGDSEQAESMYENFVKDNADNAQALECLGELALEKSDYEKAVEYFELALDTKQSDNEQTLRRNLILAYEYSGDFASAKTAMKSYTKDYPKDEEAQREYVFLQTR